MKQSLLPVSEVITLIQQGKKLVLAGDESVLEQLPQGHWIGGTIPYFMTSEGGLMSKQGIFVNELPGFVRHIVVRTYQESTISSVYRDAPMNGFTIIIMPAASPIHLSFALGAPTYPGFASSPLIGWIAGSHLNDVGKLKAKVFFGENGKVLENAAVAMHVTLPDDYYADLNILNIFDQGDGDAIEFEEDGFDVKQALINGKKALFADYLKQRGLDTRFPLVADYCGAMINISFQNVDEATGTVSFYAPVFKGVEYRHAKPVIDYVRDFTMRMPDESGIFFSCNCILNYLYSELEGKKTGTITGPVTFGEVAYQLLNQTLVYITIEKR